MNTAFSLALLSTAAFATDLSVHQQALFMGFVATNNKEYRTAEEMGSRLGVFLQNHERIAQLNMNNKGVSFEMNYTGDMTPEEFLARQALRTSNAEIPAQSAGHYEREEDNGGRRLQESMSINWATNGKMSPVKNQGGCGSCWAFAAVTAQEAMQAIKDDTTPIRLSEQEGVDCVDKSHGCGGGWMNNYWDWSKANGSQTNEDYPYQESTLACRNQTGKTSVSSVESYRRFSDVPSMKAAIQDGPLSIAVNASPLCWQFYSEGVISSESDCPTNLNHGVVVVGLHIAAGTDDENCPQELDRQCRRATRRERRQEQCANENEELEANRNGRPNRHCCTYTPIETACSTTDDQDYWIIQNSWGPNWGDNGFIRLAVEGDLGVSGMNQYVEQVQVADDVPPPQEPDCTIDESTNALGPNKCLFDSECSGDRTCSQWQWCSGTSNCP